MTRRIFYIIQEVIGLQIRPDECQTRLIMALFLGSLKSFQVQAMGNAHHCLNLK